MPLCKNPECGKEVSEDRVYCNADCFNRHIELKREAGSGINLDYEEDIWLGQRRRRRAMNAITRLARELCPISPSRFVSFVSFRTGLSRRKIADDYLETLLDVGILDNQEGVLTVVES